MQAKACKCGEIPPLITSSVSMWEDVNGKKEFVRRIYYSLSCMVCDNEEYYESPDINETYRLWNRTDEEKSFEAKYGFNPYQQTKEK